MMSVFANLEDTPMFRKNLYTLEQTSDDLKDRCQKFEKGCKKFMTSLGGACDGDLAFAESMEAFGAGCDDPISVAIGDVRLEQKQKDNLEGIKELNYFLENLGIYITGNDLVALIKKIVINGDGYVRPVMSKFTTTFRELSTYKELLHSQVEHMLSNRLQEFVNTDIRDAKDSRRRFDKAQLAYDQAREKVTSLKRGTRPDIVAALEEDLHNSKSSYERCRFNLVTALANIEAKKKYEFLESISAVMDAHLRYFKQGYELFSQTEQFIHQVLSCTQQSKEMTRIEHDKLARRIQDYRTNEKDSSKSPRNTEAPTNGDGIHIVGTKSYKNIEALMQSSANGEVQTIKQGYLLKQSSSTRGDWKRRFFVLDSHGTLYYYRNKANKHHGTQHSSGLLEHGAAVFGRFRFSHSRVSSHDDENLSYHIVDLQTSTVKIDAEQMDLRFCFRIISPHETLTLQAESEAERTEWVDNVTAVIASLLNSPFLNQPYPRLLDVDSHITVDVNTSNHLSRNFQKYNLKDTIDFAENDVSKILKSIHGNDVCAECSSQEPGWASLNLGMLICIECSGVHRNLGVHISKVRSLTLDVKIWERTVLDLFCALGNSYCNSVWEEILTMNDKSTCRTDGANNVLCSITKPGPRDAISTKEKYIQQKYVRRSFIVKETIDTSSSAVQCWEAVKYSKIKEAYRLLVVSDIHPNMIFDMFNANDICDISDAQDQNEKKERKHYDPANCPKIKASGEPTTCLRGCSLLHLACHMENLVMVELLLQFGADINMQDFHGRTPLHHCVFKRNTSLSKYLIRRGASPSVKDGGGESPLERAMKYGPITDEELFLLLVESD